MEISSLPEKALMPVRRRIAMLFQGAALFDSMTVFENVAFPLREHRRLSEEEIDKQVTRHLALVGLGSAAQEPRRECRTRGLCSPGHYGQLGCGWRISAY